MKIHLALVLLLASDSVLANRGVETGGSASAPIATVVLASPASAPDATFGSSSHGGSGHGCSGFGCSGRRRKK